MLKAAYLKTDDEENRGFVREFTALPRVHLVRHSEVCAVTLQACARAISRTVRVRALL